MTDKERIEQLETALKNLRQTILEDDTAITDTLWMPESIVTGCTAVDYIDFALDAAPASAAECVCGRSVCSYDPDFGCGIDRSEGA